MRFITFMCCVVIGVLFIVFFANTVLSQIKNIPVENQQKSRIIISVPKEGLDANEIQYTNIIKECYTLIQKNINNPLLLQNSMKPVLKPIFGDLSRTGLLIEYNCGSGKNRDDYSEIRVLVPGGEKNKSIGFAFQYGLDTGNSLFVATIERIDALKSENIDSIMFTFYGDGSIRGLGYLNQDSGIVKKTVKWNKKGKLIASKILQQPQSLEIMFEDE